MKKDIFDILKIVERGAKILSLASEDGETLDKAVEFFLSSRFSDAHDLVARYENQVSKQRRDYPSLAYREQFWIDSHGIKLAGYYYRNKAPRGIVLYVHGVRGQADDLYAIGQDYFLTHGYDVFAIDLTNSGRSTGQGVDSLSVGAKDVANAARFIRENIDNQLPLFLFGHSWGGYSVAASTYFYSNVDAVASVSGFSSPIDEMIGLPSERSGLPLGVGKEDLDALCKKRSGEFYDLSAIEAIKKNPSIPYFITIGDKDITVPVQKSSIYGKIYNLGLKNCEIHLERNKGHMDILLSQESGEKRWQYLNFAKTFAKEHGSNFAKLSGTHKKLFFSTVNIEESSQINNRLFEEICLFFERCVIG